MSSASKGIVPDNKLARRFRDEAGWLNQELAKTADSVVLVAAGLPHARDVRSEEERDGGAQAREDSEEAEQDTAPLAPVHRLADQRLVVPPARQYCATSDAPAGQKSR